jgi:hypothetical protein
MLRHACGYALANKGIDTRTLPRRDGPLKSDVSAMMWKAGSSENVPAP